MPLPASPPRIDALRAALSLLHAGRAAEAERTASALLVDEPGDLEAALVAGLSGALLGRAEAAGLLVRVARARPGHAHPLSDLARLPGGGAALEGALRAALRLDREDERLHALLAGHLQDQGRLGEALAVLGEWLALRPGAPAAHNLLGAVLAELGRTEEAVVRFREAVALDPAGAVGWSNLGIALAAEGRTEEALEACRRAVSLRPQDPAVRVNHAVALLRAGRMPQGWSEFEARLATPGHTTLPQARLLPTLSTLPGGVAGRTVLVTHEEGFGDTLQFVRYVPTLVERGARVLLSVPRELGRLLRGLGAEVMAGEGQWLPPWDWHCPVLSLPRAFGTTLGTVPAAVPYLRADPALVQRWAPALPGGPGLRVGLVWGGQARGWQRGYAAIDRRRSIPLERLGPLGAVPGMRLVSLQRGEPAAQAPPPGLVLHDPMAGVTDFADTAAIVAQLDAVVSVDTAVAHLAGALGVPVLLLDRHDACWRWLEGREDSPWYPGLRVFRQERAGDWEEPVRRVAAALGTMTAGKEALVS